MLKALKNMLGWESKGDSLMGQIAQEKALDVIEKHGYRAHYYLPTIGAQDDREFWDALETMRLAGFIVTDENGCLVGKVATARPTKQECVEGRRASFHLVNTEE